MTGKTEGVNAVNATRKLTKEENDKLQTALVKDRLAGLRMERGDYKGALEAIR